MKIIKCPYFVCATEGNYIGALAYLAEKGHKFTNLKIDRKPGCKSFLEEIGPPKKWKGGLRIINVIGIGICSLYSNYDLEDCNDHENNITYQYVEVDDFKKLINEVNIFDLLTGDINDLLNIKK